MTIKFRDIDETTLALSPDTVISSFSPFVCNDQKSEGRIRRIIKIWFKTAKRVVRRLFGRKSSSSTRSKDVIKDEYEVTWSRGYAAYDLDVGCRKPEPWLVRGKGIMADRSGVPRWRNLILNAAIKSIKPRRVLEVGCGNGINLILLANQFPDISFTGLELTDAGNRVARDLQNVATFPSALAAYPFIPATDPEAFRRINFVRGDATAMPFDDGEFDLVFTVLSIEQMERVRDKALAEIGRVSGGHVLNMEPFAEANSSLLRRAHVFGRDYFRGKIDDLSQYGLEPIWATMDFPQEVQLGAALVLSHKSI
ncbi:class I SAM-dependent methyltransferase [Roseovarius sp.]|uniref:class I SAM-dependent methyltransferase n=1 Tax=Roseovarius sp. TaxID=1486281 RepID=UPI00262615C8|nr:class I SAM-dependent methyltransferase [Roseovarius sp.]